MIADFCQNINITLTKLVATFCFSSRLLDEKKRKEIILGQLSGQFFGQFLDSFWTVFYY